jgi:hypothetical protein
MIQMEDGLSRLKISSGSKKVNPYEEKKDVGAGCVTPMNHRYQPVQHQLKTWSQGVKVYFSGIFRVAHLPHSGRNPLITLQ